MLVHGYALNHMTISVHRLQGFRYVALLYICFAMTLEVCIVLCLSHPLLKVCHPTSVHSHFTSMRLQQTVKDVNAASICPNVTACFFAAPMSRLHSDGLGQQGRDTRAE